MSVTKFHFFYNIPKTYKYKILSVIINELHREILQQLSLVLVLQTSNYGSKYVNIMRRHITTHDSLLQLL